jgi:hypothetical protein
MDIESALAQPFAINELELKPVSTNREKTRALVITYADTRAYYDRLDATVGPDDWRVEYRQLGSAVALIARVTIGQNYREDIGECHEQDPNRWTIASAQAFKRACAAFGLGRYLYSLPRLWVDYDPDRKAVRNQQQHIREMYRRAGLDTRTT